MKSVVVVVLSWNRQAAVLACIDRVKASTGADMHIVVVDNASADDSVDAIRRAHPDVTVLAETVNRGFAGGVNRGLAEASRRNADYAWLLNDDTSFDSGVLSALLVHAEAHPDVGLSSPALRDLGPHPVDQFRNGLIDWDKPVMRHNLPDATYLALVTAGSTPIVAGTALLCDLRVHRSIGPFDERFFAYWEDTDYVVRATRAGFVCTVVPSAVMLHAATPTRNHRPPHYHYYMVRNEALFWTLHYRGRAPVRWKRRWFAEALESIAQNRDLGNVATVDACIDGLWHAWTGRYGPRAAHPCAPWWLRKALAARPYLLFSLVQGDPMTVIRRIFRMH